MDKKKELKPGNFGKDDGDLSVRYDGREGSERRSRKNLAKFAAKRLFSQSPDKKYGPLTTDTTSRNVNTTKGTNESSVPPSDTPPIPENTRADTTEVKKDCTRKKIARAFQKWKKRNKRCTCQNEFRDTDGTSGTVSDIGALETSPTEFLGNSSDTENPLPWITKESDLSPRMIRAQSNDSLQWAGSSWESESLKTVPYQPQGAATMVHGHSTVRSTARLLTITLSFAEFQGLVEGWADGLVISVGPTITASLARLQDLFIGFYVRGIELESLVNLYFGSSATPLRRKGPKTKAPSLRDLIGKTRQTFTTFSDESPLSQTALPTLAAIATSQSVSPNTRRADVTDPAMSSVTPSQSSDDESVDTSDNPTTDGTDDNDSESPVHSPQDAIKNKLKSCMRHHTVAICNFFFGVKVNCIAAYLWSTGGIEWEGDPVKEGKTPSDWEVMKEVARRKHGRHGDQRLSDTQDGADYKLVCDDQQDHSSTKDVREYKDNKERTRSGNCASRIKLKVKGFLKDAKRRIHKAEPKKNGRISQDRSCKSKKHCWIFHRRKKLPEPVDEDDDCPWILSRFHSDYVRSLQPVTEASKKTGTHRRLIPRSKMPQTTELKDKKLKVNFKAAYTKLKKGWAKFNAWLSE